MDEEFFAFGIVVMGLGGWWPNGDDDLVSTLRKSFENRRIRLELRSIKVFLYPRVGPDSFVAQVIRQECLRHNCPNGMRKRHSFRVLIVNDHHGGYP